MDPDPGGKMNADPCRSGSTSLHLSFYKIVLAAETCSPAKEDLQWPVGVASVDCSAALVLSQPADKRSWRLKIQKVICVSKGGGGSSVKSGSGSVLRIRIRMDLFYKMPPVSGFACSILI